MTRTPPVDAFWEAEVERLLSDDDPSSLSRWVAEHSTHWDEVAVTALQRLSTRLQRESAVEATQRLWRLSILGEQLVRSTPEAPWQAALLALLATVEEDVVGPRLTAPRSEVDIAVRILNYRGCRLAERGDFRAAVDHFGAALTHDPGFVPAYCNRARALVELNRLDAARADAETVRSRDPAYLEGRAVRDLVAALESPAGAAAEAAESRGLLQLLRTYDSPRTPLAGPEEPVDVEAALGGSDTISRAMHDHDLALAALDAAMVAGRLSSARLPALRKLRRGEIFARQSRMEEAASEYGEALELLERSEDADLVVSAHEGLAGSARASGRLGDARAALGRALEICSGENRPAEERVRRLLGRLAEESNDLEQAKRSYGESLAIARGVEDWAGVLLDLDRLAALARHRGDLADEANLQAEREALVDELGDLAFVGSAAVARDAVIEDARATVASPPPQIEDHLEEHELRQVAFAVLSQAVRLRKQGRYEEALPFYAGALARSEWLDEPGPMATALSGAGLCYLELGYAALREDLPAAVRARQAGGGLVGIVSASYEAIRRRTRALAEQSRSCHRGALELHKAIGSVSGQATHIANLALTEQLLGNHDTARRYLLWALAAHRDTGDVDAARIDLTMLTTVERDLGDDEAAAFWELEREALDG